MEYGGKSIDTLKNQLHSRSKTYNNFQGVTEHRIAKIKSIIERRKETKKYRGIQINKGLDNYYQVLEYLTSPTASFELKTFDEKILLLILATDPELKTIKIFTQSDIPLKEPILKIEDEKERAQKLEERKEAIQLFASKVRQEIGFYDEQFLRYENALWNGLMKENGFVEDVKIPSINSLLSRSVNIKNLDIISLPNLERLKRIATKWHIEAKDPKDLNSLAYNIINRYKVLHIYTLEEQVVLFILVADHSLELLRMFAEESKYEKLEQRALDELGFYHKGLIRAEQLYHDKFEPTKKVSSWTI